MSTALPELFRALLAAIREWRIAKLEDELARCAVDRVMLIEDVHRAQWHIDERERRAKGKLMALEFGRNA